MQKRDKISIGNAGEYFVAGELERRGFTVGVPMSNVKDFDILAIHRETGKQIAVQVKTTSYQRKRWVLSEKADKLDKKDVVYVLVVLNEEDPPEYHIVPSSVVAKAARQVHQVWLDRQEKKGIPHKENPMRTFRDDEDTYLNKWEYLLQGES